jgi:hypothetical protein
MTGEHSDFYALTNHGASACTLAGYPEITLYGAHGAPLPFRYSRRHSPYVTAAAPVTVILRPDASAWVQRRDRDLCETGAGLGVRRHRLDR